MQQQSQFGSEGIIVIDKEVAMYSLFWFYHFSANITFPLLHLGAND